MAINSMQKAVRRLSQEIKPKLTADDLFQSPEFASHIQALVDTTTGRYDLPVRVVLAHKDPNATAYTDGNQIHQDTRSDLVYQYENLYNRYMAAVGMTLHECAHILFCDFDAHKKCMDALKQGLILGTEPQPETQEGKDALEEMKDAIKNPEFAPIFQQIYGGIWNCLIDPHDEDALMSRYGVFVRDAILTTCESLRMSATTVEDMMSDVGRVPGVTKLSVAFSAILQFARFGELISNDAETVFSTEIGQMIQRMSQDIMLARYTDDPIEQFGLIHKMVLALWPWVKAELKPSKDQQNDSGDGSPGSQGDQNNDQSSSGSPQSPSQQKIQEILDQLKNAAAKSGSTQQPQGAKTSKAAKGQDKKSKAGEQQRPQQKDPGDSQSESKSLDKLLSAVAMQMAEEELDVAHSRAIGSEVQAVDQNSTHRGIPVKVEVHKDVSPSQKAKYKAIMEEVGPYSKRLKRRMEETLRDIQESGYSRHRVMGNRFEARSAYRPDEHYFAKKGLPNDIPEMAISLLIDHSGSMRGGRIEAAQKAAILLHDFATSLDIPVCVSGHHAGKGVVYHTYTDFSEISRSERYRLATMDVDGCNRDGCAIEIAASHLEKQPADIKLLIVLSDGQPNHSSYGGQSAIRDIQEILSKYRRKGIEVIGTAIGADQERIKEIYGAGSFLAIDDLSTLPKVLTKIVAKRLLR